MAGLTDHNGLDRVARDGARALRRMLIQRLGLASPLLVVAAGCSPPQPTAEEGGVTTDPSSGSTDPDAGEVSTASSMGGSSSSMTESGSETDSMDSGEIRLDIMASDTPPPPACELYWLTEMEVIEQFPDCMFGPIDPNLFVEYFELCVEAPPSGDCSEICPPGELCEGSEGCLWGDPMVLETCGPFQTPEGCCVVYVGEPPPPIGRPFVIANEARLACVHEGSKDRVAAHWLAVAQGEHASIAAFARFIALLQRHAAPARLLREAIAAAGDEAHHTELSLHLAERFGGRPLALGGLDVAGAIDDLDDLDAAVCAAVREGCIGETLAAHEAACLARVAKDPEVVAALEQIAADEARHAGLAWSFVAWALARSPQLRARVAAVFAETEVEVDPDPDLDLDLDADALALGCAPTQLRARWRRLARRELVDACARELLSAHALATRARA